MHFLLWAKGSHQSPNFETSECSGENLPNSSCHFPNQKSFFSNFASVFSFMKDHLYYFRSNVIYFAQKEPIKVQIFENFECSGENLPNSLCLFPNHKSVFLQILYHFSVSWDITPLYFFSWNFIYFQQKESIKVQLVKFHVSSQKCEIFNFDGLLLSKSYKVSAKKVQKSYLSWHWRLMQS